MTIQLSESCEYNYEGKLVIGELVAFLVFFVGFDGQADLDGLIGEIARIEAKEAECSLNALGIVV